MASIWKRGDSWRAEIKRKSFPVQNKSFNTQVAAKAWARRMEASMDNGTWIDEQESRSATIDQIFDKAVAVLTSAGIPPAIPKMTQLNQIRNHFYGVTLHDLTYDEVITFAVARRKVVGASTLQTQMYYFKQIVNESRIKTSESVVADAIKWLTKKKLIKGSTQRDRRLEPGEYEALIHEANFGTRINHAHWIVHAIDIAVSSGMRQGEIHAMKWEDINFKTKIIRSMRKDLREIGGKKLHKIPMVGRMREVLLRAQDELGGDGSVFAVKEAASISDKFAIMRKKLELKDLRFHDLRHEAISQMFESGLRIEEVKLVSGHSTLEQLSRYVNLRPEEVANIDPAKR